MTVTNKTTMDQLSRTSTQAQIRRLPSSVLSVGRFSLHFLEMVLAMMVGMVMLYILLENLIPASSSYAAAFEYGTNLFDLAMGVSMTVPMVAWMTVRGHSRRHSVEMAGAMLLPVAMIIVLRLLGAEARLPWLDDASHPAMFLAMLIAMLFRHNHYTSKAGHSAHATHR